METVFRYNTHAQHKNLHTFKHTCQAQTFQQHTILRQNVCVCVCLGQLGSHCGPWPRGPARFRPETRSPGFSWGAVQKPSECSIRTFPLITLSEYRHHVHYLATKRKQMDWNRDGLPIIINKTYFHFLFQNVLKHCPLRALMNMTLGFIHQTKVWLSIMLFIHLHRYKGHTNIV